jgi:hypothetical protein
MIHLPVFDNTAIKSISGKECQEIVYQNINMWLSISNTALPAKTVSTKRRVETC